MEKEETKKKEPIKKETKRRATKKVIEVEEISTEVIREKETGFNYIEVIVIMIITLIIGGLIGSFLTKTTENYKEETKITNNVPSDLKEFVNTYEEIKNQYYKDIDTDKLVNAGIKGMIDYLGDPYSTYMDETETQSFNEQVEGNYIGIGTEITYNKDNQVIISNPFDNSPAKENGLKNGDIIVEVDGKDTKGKTLSEVSSMIKGKVNTTTTVKFKRGEEEFTKTITRKRIEITSVTSKIINKNNKKVGYIDITLFAANTGTQFANELKKLEKEKIDSLIIDVRGNSGGYLNVVTDISSLFMDKTKVIYQLETKGKKEKIYSNTKTKRTYDIAVLIDSTSASASEILASSLKESYNAEIVGTNSYGKGTVQTTSNLSNGSTIKYTIQKWLTPKGNWVNGKGVEPTQKVELTEDYYNNPSDDTDNQLQKAIEILVK